MRAYISPTIVFLFLVYLLISFLYIKTGWDHSYSFLQQKYQQKNQVNANMAAKALDYYFANLKKSLQIFAKTHQQQLNDFSQHPEDEDRYDHLLASIKEFFPQVRSFTLATSDGTPIYENIDGLVNEVCLKDIKTFSQNPRGDIMRLHANPLFYHVDVMVPWQYKVNGKMQNGVFFVNYPATFVTRILNTYRENDVHLMLVQKHDPLKIDFTDMGARHSFSRSWALTQKEFDALPNRFQYPLQHSKWILVSYTDQQTLLKEHQFLLIQLETAIVQNLLIGLVLFAGLIFFHNQSYRRNLILQELAHNDPLTGLPNRTQFIFRLKQSLLLAERGHFKLAVLFIDLNNFKPVNDQYGHHVGDELLKEVGKRLLAGRRESDIVARFGGDEFLIALNDISHGAVLDSIIHHIQQKLSEPVMIDGVEHQISASIGRAIFDDDASNIEELIDLADQQMYKIKRESKNTDVLDG